MLMEGLLTVVGFVLQQRSGSGGLRAFTVRGIGLLE